ncbi:hypothetical protein Tco_0487745 [Tanacetum coccineum]
MNEYKGIMPTKIELTLEQSQQGVCNDVLVTDNQEKDKIEAKTDKNRARNGRNREKSKKVNPDKVKVKGGADIEEMLNGQLVTI